MSIVARYPSVLPTCIPTLQEPHNCIATSDLLPHLSNLTAISNLSLTHGSGIQSLEVTIAESVATGSAEDARVVTTGYFGGGYRDCYGGNLGGWGCDVIESNSTFKNASLGPKIRKTRSTKTTSAPAAKETDERIVHVGLVVALLGLVAIVC